MMKLLSLLFVLSAVTVYHPNAEAQGRGGGGGGGRSGGGSSGGGGRSSGGGGGSHSSGGSGGRSSSGGGGGHTSSGSGSSGHSSSGSGGRTTGSGGMGGGSNNSGGRSTNNGSGRDNSNSGSTTTNNSNRNGNSSNGGGYTRSSVSAPGVGRTTIEGRSEGHGRKARDVIDYNNASGRTVLRETYSNQRNTMTRTFYNRDTAARGFYDGYQTNRQYNYNRVLYRNNVYVYVYQPLYVYNHPYWYGQFCSHHYYYNHYYNHPWSYTWWWFNDPWYGYYGYYYSPYPTYVYPSQWLVDYYWSSILADEYQDRVDANTISSQQSTIASQQATIASQQETINGLKSQLEKQVDEEMNARKAGGTVPLDKKLLDPARVYVMSTNLTFVTADAAAITCSLSSGDVLSLAQEGVSATGTTATMLVRTSKAGGCAAGTKILVSVEQLQEFENEFNRRLDLGTEKMESDNTASTILSDEDDDNN